MRGSQLLDVKKDHHLDEILNPKKKQFENLQPDLTTDDAGVANYQGKPFMTTAGACTSSIVNGTIK